MWPLGVAPRVALNCHGRLPKATHRGEARTRLDIKVATIGPHRHSSAWVERGLLRSPPRKRRKAIPRSIGKPTLEFAASIVAPLYWAQPGDDGSIL